MMSDIFDDASDLEALYRESSIAKIRNKKPLAFTGHCLYCNELIKIGRFCSAECHEDWETEEKFKKITGTR
jgi:hypothetical protein